ncbi:DNA mismatch repair protein MutS [Moraxella sp. ZY210820]|uniref:DNA mismatch repair protein MutS n=1 Tax=unclassified Moraxella TaxID=2685852 RepID=UPI00272F4156|nr:DNA mismatch repair protein MutS [Moraxella sp. ZY210820]WLF84605.1 DNA mismatch repair protein MutS [Moraxella sp. ZY210820]
MSQSSATTAQALAHIDTHTPMMQHYLQVKKEYPNALLFYRMGDFYELFFDDAHTVVKILGITLTHRGKSNGQPIPMAGVPYHSADRYLTRLVKAGQAIAICEQVGEVTGKAPVEREVVRLITAGTLTDDNLLGQHQSSSLLALCIQQQQIGMALLDLSAGIFKVQQIEYKLEQFPLELARLMPSEIIIDEDMVDTNIIDIIKNTLECTITKRPNVDFNIKNADKTLCDQFGVSTLSGFGVDELPLAKASASALIHYAKETQKTALPHICSLRVENSQQYIAIDYITRKNLEITQPLFEHGTSLFSLINDCKTAMGGRLLHRFLMQPMRDTAILEQRLESIDILLQGYHETPIRLVLQEISDIERVLSRVALGSARPRDLVQLRQAFAQIPLLRHALQPILNTHTQGLLTELTQQLGDFQPLYEHLCHAIVELPPVVLRDGNVIATGFDPELDELRQMKDNAGDFLIQMELKERQRTGIANLKIAYNKVSGYFIELTRGQAENAPSDYIRRQTLKNAERFITPELKTFEDKILSADARALAREKYLFEQILKHLQQHIAELQQMSNAIAQLDVLCNFAYQARLRHWVRPEYTSDIGIEIIAGRHPVVEALSKTAFVANDTLLNQQHRLSIITGPNMGGKSTYMRQTALICILAYCGSFVPAQSAKLGSIDRIFTRIGSADDLSTGKSTFMVEMTETAQILHHATAHSLVLMDEVGRGTSTYDGLSLAWACVLDLSKRIKCLCLFATHYFELTELGNQAHIQNQHVTAVEANGNLILLHKVQAGPASQSHGLQVAKLAGIPTSVIKEAQKRLKILEKQQIATPQNQQADLFAESEDIIHHVEHNTQQQIMSSPQIEYIEVEKPSPIIKQLKQLNIDDLSPRQALEQLYQLKELLKE